jgi:hypothetical protein
MIGIKAIKSSPDSEGPIIVEVRQKNEGPNSYRLSIMEVPSSGVSVLGDLSFANKHMSSKKVPASLYHLLYHRKKFRCW